jgi:hypothetical protein
MAKPIDFIVDDNGCFVCTSHKRDKDGYPKRKWNGSSRAMSRFIYIQMFGEIPDGLVVRHKCDNRACINPEHLELGTMLDNNHDRDERGRTSKGIEHHWSKLDESTVKKIKMLLENGITPTDIAKRLNISRYSVYDIKYQRIWKHVDAK